MVASTEQSDLQTLQPASFKRVHIIVNPAAGQERPFLKTLNDAFRQAQVDWDVFITKGEGDATRLAQASVQAGADVVVAHGGDGTVGEVANGLIGSSVPLAILPGGTANVMSLELGIPGDLGPAVALLCGQGRLVPVDMARANDRLLLLRAMIGFAADATKGAVREEKDRFGSLAYVISALRELPNAQSSHYTLMLDGETVETDGMICMVGNSGNLGLPGVSLQSVISVSDGLLDVVVIRSVDLGTLFSVAASAAGVANPFPHWQVKEVTVVADPPQTVECDGEVIEPTPFRAQILPAAIQVVVPLLPAAPPANP
ncbi:MAG TPA: diacylglycerol kinase family protein [Phototrophicaceae bacterium]|nr:diacylglycerol kinase family protein [Phototrophicaceae bacterium]